MIDPKGDGNPRVDLRRVEHLEPASIKGYEGARLIREGPLDSSKKRNVTTEYRPPESPRSVRINWKTIAPRAKARDK